MTGNVWVHRSESRGEAWIYEDQGIVRAISFCCNGDISRRDLSEAYCDTCGKVVEAKSMTFPVGSWSLPQHIGTPNAVVEWISNWTLIPKKDIHIRVEWPEEES